VNGQAGAALVLEGIRKSFGANEVLKGIDLSVAPHEVVCLIGASGSGKSTLLRCTNLVEPIDAGRVVVEGEEITAQAWTPTASAGRSASSTSPSTSSPT
jgi:polar amino acid transport system ATP-binding protein